MDRVTATACGATVSGGALLIDAGTLAPVTVVNSTFASSTAGAVGGGIAIRATDLIAVPGSRSATLDGVSVMDCSAHRGGGI